MLRVPFFTGNKLSSNYFSYSEVVNVERNLTDGRPRTTIKTSNIMHLESSPVESIVSCIEISVHGFCNSSVV